MARWVLVAMATFLFVGAAKAAELVMVEAPGCHWCAKWNEDIGPSYPKTAEGQFAPLRRMDLRARDHGIEFKRRVAFTPTFVLVEDGMELARIEGHPGEHFFWPMLDQMLRAHTAYGGGSQ